jgi:superfamily II DNA or RNA helicase
VIAAFIAQRFAERNQAVYFNCHRSELLRQTSGTFTNCGLPHGFIAAGQKYSDALTQVCSIDTLKRRLQSVPEPKVVIWDECHHIGAAGWAAIMAAWPNAYHIGLTGTPWRLDGSGLGVWFEEMVIGPTPAELIAWGNLSPYEIYAPSAPDMSKRRMGGDFVKAEAAAKMPKLTGDMIEHWRRHASGMRTVGYAPTIATSKHFAAQFNSAGIPAAHLDGDTPDDERRATIQAYADGAVLVLWNVGLFGEGFDLSAWAGRPVTIDAGILGNPTTSLSKYLQEAMRPMRPAPGKVAVLLDHAGNSMRHGFPDDEHEWTLEGRPKGKAANDNGPPPPVTCGECFRQIRRPLPPCCPGCGKDLQAEAAPVIKVAAGTLHKVTEAEKKQQRADKKQETKDAKTLDALIALAMKRGYKNPLEWARHEMGRRTAWRLRA